MEQRGQPKSTLSVVASARAGYGRHRAAGDQAVRYGQTSRYRSVQQGRIQVASSTSATRKQIQESECLQLEDQQAMSLYIRHLALGECHAHRE